jgi:hypothetical protein
MIKLLEEFFQEFHYIVGISLPLRSTSNRTFVFVWLSSIVGGAAFCVVMFYIILLLYFGHR